MSIFHPEQTWLTESSPRSASFHFVICNCPAPSGGLPHSSKMLCFSGMLRVVDRQLHQEQLDRLNRSPTDRADERRDHIGSEYGRLMLAPSGRRIYLEKLRNVGPKC